MKSVEDVVVGKIGATEIACIKKVVLLKGHGDCGKTTILNSIAGILPYEGSIEGHEDGVSYIFQKDRLIPTITIYKNLDLILRSQIKDKK